MYKNIRFTMSTPRCIEHQKNILIIVYYDVFISMGHDNGHRSNLFFRNRLRFNAWFNFFIKDILNELRDIFFGYLFALVIWKLLVSDGVLDSECRKDLWIKIKITSMVTKCVCIDRGNINEPFESSRNRLKKGCKGSAFFRGFGKNICQWNASLFMFSMINNKLVNDSARV